MKTARDAVQLADRLCRRVLAPLLQGGQVQPLSPIGSARALAAIQFDLPPPDDLAQLLGDLRIREARRLCPVDCLPDIGRAEWLMGFALNDLLQATNPRLVGTFGRDRPRRLIEMADRMLDAAGSPDTVVDALGRHATFSRIVELTRIDTTVSWWVGSELFQGRLPPARLTAWPELRRVRRHQEQVRLVDMPPPDAQWRTTWLECMAKLYSASPLTDLSQVDRPQPAFRWTGGLCGFTRNPVGRRLALRAVGRTTDRPRAVATLLAAARHVESEAARAHADAFAAEVDSIR